MEEKDIELHPEEAKQRQDVDSSLTDLNRINVFSAEFQNTVKQVTEKKKQLEKDKREEIFVEEIVRQGNSDMQITSLLFMDRGETVLSHNYFENNTKWSLMDVSFILIAVMVVSALYLFFFQDRKAKK